MKDKICEHHYESRTVKVQQLDKHYMGDGKYNFTILEQEEHYIFCNKCGDSKLVWGTAITEKAN